MTKREKYHTTSRSQAISRRQVLKLAAAAGLLAGCRRGDRATTKAIPARRPDIIRRYPHAPSKVVHARHARVWDADALSPEAARQMLDASISEVTGLDDATAAWAALFDPGERIAIKVNSVTTGPTTPALVMAVTERLLEAGIPGEQITIFDRSTLELEWAGYAINQDGPGVRCYGTDGNYTPGWTIMDTDVSLSDILIDCDALINMPTLKQISWSGISFALKNHFGSFDKPQEFHERMSQGLAKVNALPPIQERTRLIIGDALKIYISSLGEAVAGDAILVSFDPVAHDRVGLQVYSQALVAEGRNPESATRQATPCLANAMELGLGTSNLDDVDLVEISLDRPSSFMHQPLAPPGDRSRDGSQGTHHL